MSAFTAFAWSNSFYLSNFKGDDAQFEGGKRSHEFSTIYGSTYHIVVIIFLEATNNIQSGDKLLCTIRLGRKRYGRSKPIVATSFRYNVVSNVVSTEQPFLVPRWKGIQTLARPGIARLRKTCFGERSQSAGKGGCAASTGFLANVRFDGSPARRILYSNAR
jgi:hypothetical protein